MPEGEIIGQEIVDHVGMQTTRHPIFNVWVRVLRKKALVFPGVNVDMDVRDDPARDAEIMSAGRRYDDITALPLVYDFPPRIKQTWTIADDGCASFAARQ